MRFNPNLVRSWFGAVMALIDMITMLSVLLTGSALIRERERGTVEHLLVMPVTPFEIMTSKVWSMGLVVLVTSAVSLDVVVQGVLSVPIQGSVALFLCGTALHLFATTSLGMFLATFARTMPQFALLLIMVLLPLADALRRHDSAGKHARVQFSKSCWRRPPPTSSCWPRASCSEVRG